MCVGLSVQNGHRGERRNPRDRVSVFPAGGVLEVKAVARRAALICIGSVALAACSTSAPSQTTGTGAAISAADAHARASCPAGHLMPHGGTVLFEWVDFVQFHGRQYIAGLSPTANIRESDLGAVITRIRCSITALDDRHHVGFRLVDRSAAFIRAGAPVFAVRGYSPRCRLASYVGGQLHVYLAQHDVNGHTAPLRCAS